ncbi:FtsX-like permease family protein [Nocardia sp. NPDC020380]|uniref:FtsX-like permease family protein n=1 Tax=Nocardia sp. NPDC020380 TaxID=3364309 RepID=UPI0037AF1B85
MNTLLVPQKMLPQAQMMFGLAVGQLRRLRRQTVLVLIISIALLASLLIPAGLYLSYRHKISQAIAATVLPGELIVTSNNMLPTAAVDEALAAAPGACALSQISGQVVVHTGAVASQSIPGYFVRSSGTCADPGAALTYGPADLVAQPAAAGPDTAAVMGISGASGAIETNAPVTAAATSVRFGDEALAREILGAPEGYSLVALSGPGARTAADRLAEAGGSVRSRADYLGELTSQQISNVSFVGVIAIIFAAVLVCGLTAALVFSLILLAMSLRPQFDILRRIGVPNREIRTVKAIQAGAILLAATIVGTALAFAADALIPANQLLLGTFTVDGVALDGWTWAGAVLAIAVAIGGAWLLGDSISGTKRAETGGAAARFALARRAVVPVCAAASIGLGIWSTVSERFGFTGLVLGYCLVLAGLFLLAAPALRVFTPFTEVGGTRGVLLPWFGLGSVGRVRTQAAVAVSCIGFTATLVAIISVFATSTDTSINRQIDANVGAQMVVEPKTGFVISSGDIAALRSAPGASGAVAVAPQNGVDISGRVSNGVAVDGPLDSGALQLTMVGGATTVSPDTAMVSASQAAKLGVGVGDSITLGTASIRVAGIYRDAPTLGDFVVSADHAAGAGFQYVLIRDSQPAAFAQVRAVAAGLPNLVLRSIDEYRVKQKADSRIIIEALTQLSGVVGVGLLLALGVVLGVLSGGRVREWSMLRRIGFSRGLVLRSVGVEATAVSIVGVAAGLGVGSAFGYAVCKYLSWAGLTDVVLDPATSAGAGAGLVAIGVLVYLLACSSALRQAR